MATVLVVDDEPDMLMQLRSALEADGHEVVLASDGRMALARVAELVPDAVVLDLRMPVLDGLGVLEELGRRSDATPVVVLLPGLEAADEGRRALELGALDLLVKPVSSEALRRSVDEVLALTTDEARVDRRHRSLQALGELS